jgi:hypothetical protein
MVNRNDFTFEKDLNDRWYVVLPEWNGDRKDLEMVMGADTMLDIIAQGESKVDVTLSLTPITTTKMILELDRIAPTTIGGAYYELKSKLHNFEIWLCDVTLFVFNEFPKTIYVSY